MHINLFRPTRRWAYFVVAVFLAPALFWTLSSVSAGTPGNGALSGPHYDLNLIGVPKDKTAPMDDNSGHRIFVNLDGKTSIGLAEGPTFAVLDANGTDANGAKFELPNPDTANSGVTLYSVYARALGKPGGHDTLSTCATAPGPDGIFGTADDEAMCSVATLALSRPKGQQKFVDVSRYLLYIYVDLNGDGIPERYPLFSDALQNYFWSVDNYGLKNVQLRFYQVPSNVN